MGIEFAIQDKTREFILKLFKFGEDMRAGVILLSIARPHSFRALADVGDCAMSDTSRPIKFELNPHRERHVILIDAVSEFIRQHWLEVRHTINVLFLQPICALKIFLVFRLDHRNRLSHSVGFVRLPGVFALHLGPSIWADLSANLPRPRAISAGLCVELNPPNEHLSTRCSFVKFLVCSICHSIVEIIPQIVANVHR